MSRRAEPMRLIFAFLAGGLFGAGLLISRMVDTRKVQGWLDVFGDWDPTLAFVLGGAVLPMVAVWRLAYRRRQTFLGGPIPPKPPLILDRNLLLGSLLFGIGWGLAGLCPGPSIAVLGFGGLNGWIFLIAMIAGMLVWPGLRAALDRPPVAPKTAD